MQAENGFRLSTFSRILLSSTSSCNLVEVFPFHVYFVFLSISRLLCASVCLEERQLSPSRKSSNPQLLLVPGVNKTHENIALKPAMMIQFYFSLNHFKVRSKTLSSLLKFICQAREMVIHLLFFRSFLRIRKLKRTAQNISFSTHIHLLGEKIDRVALPRQLYVYAVYS